MRLNNDSEAYKAHEKHAWTLAFIAWLAGAAVLWLFSDWLGGFRYKGIGEFLQMLLYPVLFFYILVLGRLKDYFLARLLRETRKP